MEGPRRLLPLLVAGGVVVAAVYAAGALGPTAHETTTTSTTLAASLVDEELSGPILDWRPLGPIGEGSPIALGRFGDAYLTFTVIDGTVLSGWRSADLTTWEALPMGDVPEADWWSTVLIDDSGIVAIGDAGGVPAVWVSESGDTWRPLDVPETGTPFGGTQVVGGLWHEGSLLLYGTRWRDAVTEVLVPALPPDWQAAVADGDLWPDFDGFRLSLRGPMDLPVYQATLEELGVTKPIPNSYGSSAHLWMSDDATGLETITALDEGYLNTIFHTPEGSLVASAGTDSGPVLLTSADGRTWDEANTWFDLYGATTWRNELVTESNSQLWRSDDGIHWEIETFPRDLLPRQPLGSDPWYLDRVAGGGIGLVALETSWTWPATVGNQPSGTTLEQNGYRLEQSWSSGRITVWDSAGQQVLSFDSWSELVDPSVGYDPVTRAIVLSDPSAGTPLMTVTTEQWQAANEAVWATQTQPEPTVKSLLIFTADGETWSASAPEWLTVDPSLGTHGPILVEDDRVLAIATANGSIALWEGTLPG